MANTIQARDRFYSSCGNLWEVLEVTGNWAKVIRKSYYWEGEWYFPKGETPHRFDVCALEGMQRAALGFYPSR